MTDEAQNEPSDEAMALSARLTTSDQPFSVSEYEVARLSRYEQLVLKKTAQKNGWASGYNAETGVRDFRQIVSPTTP